MRLHLSAVLFALIPTFAFAQAVLPSCPVPDGMERTEDIQTLPLPVAHSLQRHVPNLSPPGSRFNGGDALSPGQTTPDRRLVEIFHRGSRWVIVYEAAGRGYHLVVVTYDVSQDRKRSIIAFKAQTRSAIFCRTFDQALTSISGPIDRYW
jgi:hypothetical protein